MAGSNPLRETAGHGGSLIGIIYFVVIMALTKLSDRLEKRMVNEPARTGSRGS